MVERASYDPDDSDPGGRSRIDRIGPPDRDTGEAVHADIDHLFVVDETAKARVGDLALAVWAGDGVHVEAGIRHREALVR